MGTFEDMIARGDWLVLDTETTGLARPAEIVQIAVVDAAGTVRLDTLVKPKRPIPADATRVHGITNAHVADAPGWERIQPQLAEIIDGHDVIIYNASYDRKLLRLSDEAAGLGDLAYHKRAAWYCAMLWYARIYGERSRFGDFKWQSLSKAMVQQGLSISNAHHALGDVLMTRELIRHVCHLDNQQLKMAF